MNAPHCRGWIGPCRPCDQRPWPLAEWVLVHGPWQLSRGSEAALILREFTAQDTRMAAALCIPGPNMEWETGALMARRPSANPQVWQTGARTSNIGPRGQERRPCVFARTSSVGETLPRLEDHCEKVGCGRGRIVSGERVRAARCSRRPVGMGSGCWTDWYFDPSSAGSTWMTRDCGQRAVRGGSGGNDPGTLRSLLRYSLDTDDWRNDVGVRVARIIER